MRVGLHQFSSSWWGAGLGLEEGGGGRRRREEPAPPFRPFRPSLQTRPTKIQHLFQYELYDREHQARKTSLKDNLRDVFMHQTGASDPGVRSFDAQPKCSRCRSKDHFTVSCPLKETLKSDSSDDVIVKSLFIPPGEEAPRSQIAFVAKIHKSWGI